MRRDIPLTRWQSLRSDHQGLSGNEVLAQRARFGDNAIIEAAVNPRLELARETLKDPMIWFLVMTALAYACLGNYPEALTLVVAIPPLIAMDAFLHRRVRVSAAGPKRQPAATARVWRDGVLREIPAIQLVPGDRVQVISGESIPADGLIVDCEQPRIDESSLTGEANPVGKRALSAWPSRADEQSEYIRIDGIHWGLAGTRLLTGSLTLRIVYTGSRTLHGEIVQTAAIGKREWTFLQSSLAALVGTFAVASGVLCLFLAGVRLRQGHEWADMLIGVAALAVTALPVVFPAVFSVYLGVGVYCLARRKALVRLGGSAETIGRVTCVCSDKTGTITEGRLRLEHLEPASPIMAGELLFWAGLASRGDRGDSLDGAILRRLAEQPNGGKTRVMLAAYPYTEQRRRETAVVRLEDRLVAVSKGAPEVLLGLASLDAQERRAWSRRVDLLAAQGHKVLACAYWELPEPWAGGEPDRAGVFAGLLAYMDPVREGVVDAVRDCRAAGIHVILITGDHPATAAAVGREIGLLDAGSDGIVLGDDLEALGSRIEWGEIRVVARALPAHKPALVRALKERGEIVAVTGDGGNDAPALRAADAGIARGERGTRAARETASIVLLNDSFDAIVQAIAEGRKLFRNLQLGFQYLLMTHIPLAITAAFIPLAGYPILYLPIHILWYEALIHPTALLVFQELPARGLLSSSRRRQTAGLFSPAEWGLIGVVATLLTILVSLVYERGLQPGMNVEHGRAMAMVVLTCAGASATALLSRLRTPAAWVMTGLTLLTALGFVQIPDLAHYLSLRPLPGDDWLIAMAGGFLSVAMPMAAFHAAGRWWGRMTGRRRAETGEATETARGGAGQAAPSLTRYAWWSVLTAVATIALKSGAYLLTGSVALLSDAAESLVNLTAAIFALIALRFAHRPADETHPFGHGRAEYFSSGFEGAMILVAAVGILLSAWERLQHPQGLEALDIGILISIAAAILNGGMALTLLRAGRRFQSITLEADGRHLMTDVWTTVAILLGLGGLALTGWLWLDSVIAMLAALNIVSSGVTLIRRSLSGLLGVALPVEERQLVEAILEKYRRQGIQFHDLRARIAGSHRLITLHVLVPGDMAVQQAHELMENIEGDIRARLQNLLVVTHVEPLDDPASFRHDIL